MNTKGELGCIQAPRPHQRQRGRRATARTRSQGAAAILAPETGILHQTVSRPGCKSEPFARKGLFFSFSLAIPHLGLLSHISSLRLPQGHLGPILTLSTNYAVRSSLSSPQSLVAEASVWATSLLAVLIRCDFVVVSPSYDAL